ncbi:unnamed protein product, partial [Brassica rapa subsp. trilocularis]
MEAPLFKLHIEADNRSFKTPQGMELHWMGDGSAGTKEAENNAIWWFSRRTVLMTVPDSGATRVIVPSECSSGRDFLGNYNHYG